MCDDDVRDDEEEEEEAPVHVKSIDRGRMRDPEEIGSMYNGVH